MMVFVIVVAIVEIVVILLIGCLFVVCKLEIGVEEVAVEGNYFYCC